MSIPDYKLDVLIKDMVDQLLPAVNNRRRRQHAIAIEEAIAENPVGGVKPGKRRQPADNATPGNSIPLLKKPD